MCGQQQLCATIEGRTAERPFRLPVSTSFGISFDGAQRRRTSSAAVVIGRDRSQSFFRCGPSGANYVIAAAEPRLLRLSCLNPSGGATTSENGAGSLGDIVQSRHTRHSLGSPGSSDVHDIPGVQYLHQSPALGRTHPALRLESVQHLSWRPLRWQPREVFR